MKSDFSTWTHQPMNPVLLKAYAENALLEGITRGIVPVVVWRDGEATLTLTPKEEEQIYDFGITDYREDKIDAETQKGLDLYNSFIYPEEPKDLVQEDLNQDSTL